MTAAIMGFSMAAHNRVPVRTTRVPVAAWRKRLPSRSTAIQTQQEFFMPYVAMPFIQFNDVGGVSLDLSTFLSQGFDPLMRIYRPRWKGNGSKDSVLRNILRT
jgi:hypothetical protein